MNIEALANTISNKIGEQVALTMEEHIADLDKHPDNMHLEAVLYIAAKIAGGFIYTMVRSIETTPPTPKRELYEMCVNVLHGKLMKAANDNFGEVI